MKSCPFYSRKAGRGSQRDHYQADETDQIWPFLAKYPSKIHISYHHPYHQHTGRRHQAAHALHAGGEDRRKPDLRREQQNSRCQRNNIGIQQDLAVVSLRFPLQHTNPMGPCQEILYQQKCRGIKHPFFSQHGTDQRNHQISRIGINDRHLFYTVQPKRLFQNPYCQEHKSMGGRGSRHSQQKPFCGPGRQFNLEGIDDHTREAYIHYQIGKNTAVLRFK